MLNESATEFEIRPSTDHLSGLIFVPVPEAKHSTIRLHLDFRPDDQQAEVGRFLRVGARRVDMGQGSSPWVVLADPEGNRIRASTTTCSHSRLTEQIYDRATAMVHRALYAAIPDVHTDAPRE